MTVSELTTTQRVDGEWRAKYRELCDEFDALKGQEHALRRRLAKLLAAAVQSETAAGITPLLETLREDGSMLDPAPLQGAIDAVLRGSDAWSDWFLLLDRLRIPLSQDLALQTLRERATGPGATADRLGRLAEPISEFRDGVPHAMAAGNPPTVGAAGDAAPVRPTAGDFAQLLDWLLLPGEFEVRAETLRRALIGGRSANPMQDIGNFLNDLYSFLRRDLRDLGEYLKNATLHLNAVESELANALADSRHVAQASSELTARLDSEVTAIDRAVNGDLPVSELRALIDARVQSMRSAMTDYVSAQQIRQADYERRLSDFGSRVQQFEKESALLREGLLAAQERSHRDALTQLPNRLAFDERAHLELQRARRSGVALTLAVLDLDHFKRINDRFGHKIGDRVLKHAALLFQRRTRATDFLARYGGEEFVILYADTRLDEAYRAAEELRARLELATFQYRGERVPVTVSIGMAGLQLGEAMDRLFERADLALYDAKKLGRNRIVTA